VVTADFVYHHFYNPEIGVIDYNRFNRLRRPIILRAPTARPAPSNSALRWAAPITYALVRQYGLNGINNLDVWFDSRGPQGGRHSLNVSGMVDLPWKVQASFINPMGSRGAYRPSVSGVDLDDDGLNTAFLPGWTVSHRHPTRGKLAAAVAAWNAAYTDLDNGQRPRTSRNQVIPRRHRLNRECVRLRRTARIPIGCSFLILTC
jgi:hypothetical protein